MVEFYLKLPKWDGDSIYQSGILKGGGVFLIPGESLSHILFKQFLKRKQKSRKRGRGEKWHPDAWLCAESLYMGTDGHLTSHWQVSPTLICGSISL